MRKGLVRMISVLLSVILITSVFTALPVYADAVGGDEPTPKSHGTLLGDVDGEGAVTVLDATLIQRALASLDTLDTVQGYLADVDGDDEVTILDATAIQRFLSDLDAPEGIGKPMTEVYRTVSVPVLREKLDSEETADVRFYADQPHVPYINVRDFYNQFYLIGTDLKEGMTCTQKDNEYTLQR